MYVCKIVATDKYCEERGVLIECFLALLDYVSRAHEIEIRPLSVVRLSVRRPSVHPSVASIISEVIAWISFKF